MKLLKISRLFIFSMMLCTVSTTSSGVVNAIKDTINNNKVIVDTTKNETPKNIKITFNEAGGILSGNKIIQTTTDTAFGDLTDVPTVNKGGMINDGWYYTNGSKQIKVEASTKFTDNITLNANWTYHDIVFSSGSGVFKDGSKKKTFHYKMAYHDGEVETPVCEGMVFNGWKKGEEKISFPIVFTEPTTLVASYIKPVSSKITICAYSSDGTFEDGTKFKYVDAVANETKWSEIKAQLLIPVIEGDSSFSKWVDDRGWAFYDDYTFSSTTLIKATYAKAIKITFNANGGEFPDGSLTKESAYIHLPTKTTEHITFSQFLESISSSTNPPKKGNLELLGWYYNPQANGKMIKDSDEITLKESFEVYAWYKEEYHLIKDAEEGKPDDYTIVYEDPNKDYYYRSDSLRVGINPIEGTSISSKSAFKIKWGGQIRKEGTDYKLTSKLQGWVLEIEDCPSCDISIILSPYRKLYYLTLNSGSAKDITKSMKMDGLEYTKDRREYKKDVKINIELIEGYYVTNIVTTYANSQVETYPASNGEATIKINYPCDCVVTFEYKEKSYDVKCNHDGNFVSLSTGKEKHRYKDTVIITWEVSKGYDLSSIVIKYNGVEETIDPNNPTFVMPCYPVEVYGSATKHIYKATWINKNGSVAEPLAETNVPYLETPKYPGDTPTYDGGIEDPKLYTFSGWDPAPSAISQDTVYTAQYTETPKKLKVVYENYDQSLLYYKADVTHGSYVKYERPDPTRQDDVENKYVFNGWAVYDDKEGWISVTPETYPIKQDTTFVAQYEATTRSYTVTFKNYDNSTLATTEVKYGTVPSYTGDIPTRPSEGNYDYVFSGWTPALHPVIGNTTYYAKYEKVAKSYNIIFQMIDYDGSVKELQNTKELYNTPPKYTGDTPTKIDPTGKKTYTFKGWDKDIELVTGDATYTAVFTESINKYKLGFNENGGKIKSGGKEVTSRTVDADTVLLTYISQEAITATHDYAVFKGWSLDGGTSLIDGTTTMPCADSTLTAIWKTYDIQAVTNDGIKSMKTDKFSGVLEVHADELNISLDDGYVLDHFEYYSEESSTWKALTMPFRPGSIDELKQKDNSAGYTLKIRPVCEKVTEYIELYLDANGGYFLGGDYTKVVRVKKGSKFYDIKTNPNIMPAYKYIDKVKYEITRWAGSDGNEIDNQLILNEDMYMYVLGATPA